MSRLLLAPFRALLIAAAVVAMAQPAGAIAAEVPPAAGLPGAVDTPPTTLPTEWACFPGRVPNPCEGSLEATVLSNTQLQPRRVARVEEPPRPADPPVDCFYVYGSVTGAAGSNAPRRLDADVRWILESQAAPLTSRCRVFAPIYRQVTTPSMATSILGGQRRTSDAQNLAFSDVRGAWQDYLAHDNHGRGVVLIGHSQGSAMLMRLITTDVDDDPAVRAKLVSAILPGGNVLVRAGERTGGVFANIPTCATPGEIGCVIAYSMFAQHPTSNALFGRNSVISSSFGGPPSLGLRVACTNPAELSGDHGTLRPFLRSTLAPGGNGSTFAALWNGLPPRASTPYVVPGDHFTVRCDRYGDADVLRLRSGRGTLVPLSVPWADWGLHVAEYSLSLGNLLTVIGDQSAAYLSAAGG